MGILSNHLAVDLGSENTRIFVKGKGIVINEPSIAAVKIGRRSSKILEVGAAAKKMIGKTPHDIELLNPVRDGAIADFDVLSSILQYYFKKKLSRHFFARTSLVFAVPDRITAVEKRAMIESGEDAGAHKVFLINSSIAAALGAELPVEEPICSMVVDIGAGKTQIAALSLADIVHCESVPASGHTMNRVIAQLIKAEHDLLAGPYSVEILKIKLGVPINETDEMQDRGASIKGRDISTGMPKTIPIGPNEVRTKIQEQIEQIADAIVSVLEKIAPELSSDIADRGITLTGGVSQMKGLAEMLKTKVGVTINTAKDPLSSVIMGAGKLLDHPSLLERVSL
jgi:rod shape-determining protein MreB